MVVSPEPEYNRFPSLARAYTIPLMMDADEEKSETTNQTSLRGERDELPVARECSNGLQAHIIKSNNRAALRRGVQNGLLRKEMMKRFRAKKKKKMLG